MILKTFDNQEMYVTAEQAEAIWAAKLRGEAVTVTSSVTGAIRAYLAAGAIAKITPGGSDPDERHLAQLPKPTTSPEKRRANAERFRQLRDAAMAKKGGQS